MTRRPSAFERAAFAALRARDDRPYVACTVAPSDAPLVVDLRLRATPPRAREHGEVLFVRVAGACARWSPLLADAYACGDDAAEVQLVRADRERCTVVRRGWYPLRVTPARTLSAASSDVGRWIADALHGRTAAREDVLAGDDRRPTQVRAARAWARIVTLGAARVARRLRTGSERWNVGVIDAPIHALLHETPPVRWLSVDDGGDVLADPFALPDHPETVLCERVDPRSGVGEIVCVDTTTGAWRGVLRTAAHLSFPFVFRWEHATYVLPESYQSGRLTLYRLHDGAVRPVEAQTLLAIDACDPALVRHAGRWWLFCSRASREPNVNLFVYWADALAGPWHAHTGNPVKTDVRSARSGGTPFVHDGVTYRPAQDCSSSYGGAVVINRIDELTPTAFAETPVRRIAPDPHGPFPHGLHTLSAAGPRCYVDGRRDA